MDPKFGLQWAIALAVSLLFVGVWLVAPGEPEQRFQLARYADTGDEVILRERIASDGKTIMVHAPSIVELEDGRLLAAWFGGSREGARDVTIDGAYYDPKTSNWTPSFTLVSPRMTQEGTRRFIKKLGNPVLVNGPDGQLWMIYVSVSVGGWATSQLNLIKSTDAGLSWGIPERLVTSPFFNLSTLVKGVPFRYEDGTLGVPAYHEFAGKFGEVLRLDQDGRLIDKVRLSDGKESLQPVVLPRSPEHAHVYLRFAGEEGPYRVLKTRLVHEEAADTPEKIGVANPNSALAGFSALGMEWLIGNDTEDERDRLALLVASPEGEWRVAHYFEDASHLYANRPQRREFEQMMEAELSELLKPYPHRHGELAELKGRASGEMCRADSCYFQYDYPYAIRTRSGNIQVVFTWNRSAIKHLEFSEGWLRSLL
ncbi:exo-alpha-sialidase [Aestuariirhabdus litorea]|uniref:Sialidase domain-containing protein n=1 Tax=Aestuariirhabdus litorea TaxID=2528527 RepID=A0A3P3VQ18_9GAMM|nr:sialidase family protein [Aestuariirhabdus litorea]RRJ84825.1 hypothetical protein D0544_06960 [Aestuariirhabdus litorea]RWW98050.1 hypothetical protein DZC74_06955 [Endozoicomonadaceae bacterium GTF-13]